MELMVLGICWVAKSIAGALMVGAATAVIVWTDKKLRKEARK